MFKEEKKPNSQATKHYRADLKHAGSLIEIQSGHHHFEDFNMCLHCMDKQKFSQTSPAEASSLTAFQ
ncbi:hypothetical protein AV530_009906 [Patagioenas fasciata monilis]|uniref:Uncharacterized protein n=1 Tax=Patagioenas fasciata monilis TaxID=372326 RepID=A0A1V4KAT0_PATFA|nr:hypothetical protein AV530_009906 [Patagioenas fasciata monilis]